MSEPYLGQIQLFSFPFAPKGYLRCDGQLLSIAQNQALFSILGTNYGGDGRTTFALPDLRGRAPFQYDNQFPLGARGGQETHTLISPEMPQHNHMLLTDATTAGTSNVNTPASNTVFGQSSPATIYGSPASSSLDPTAVGANGGSQPHNNLMPYLAINYSIATQGLFPSRS